MYRRLTSKINLRKNWRAFSLFSTCSIGVYSYYSYCNYKYNDRKLIFNDFPIVDNKRFTDMNAVIQLLKQRLPDGAITTSIDIINSSINSQWSYLVDKPPTAIVYPSSTQEVVEIVKVAKEYKIPLICRSAGTSLEGQCSSERGGILIDFEENMNKIIDLHADDLDVVVQPGLKWMHLNEYLEENGQNLFFPLDPSPDAAVGGILNNGSSGTNSVLWGTARGEWFINATVVMADGSVMKTRQRSKKSSAGIDLLKLFVGSEGTLGIITELTLRLAPKLPTSVAIAPFNSVEDAGKVVTRVVQNGIRVNCAELLDDVAMKANNDSGIVSKRYEEKPHVFFKFAGQPVQMEDDARRTAEIVNEFNSTLHFAKSDSEAKELWDGRKWALTSAASMLENARVWTTDVCVPISKLPQIIKFIKQDTSSNGVVTSIVSHAADGNVHALMLFRNEEEKYKVEECVDRMINYAIDLEGTCTGMYRYSNV